MRVGGLAHCSSNVSYLIWQPRCNNDGPPPMGYCWDNLWDTAGDIYAIGKHSEGDLAIGLAVNGSTHVGLELCDLHGYSLRLQHPAHTAYAYNNQPGSSVPASVFCQCLRVPIFRSKIFQSFDISVFGSVTPARSLLELMRCTYPPSYPGNTAVTQSRHPSPSSSMHISGPPCPSPFLHRSLPASPSPFSVLLQWIPPNLLFISPSPSPSSIG